MDDHFYQQLASTFPPAELFSYKKSLGHKYSLSEGNNRSKYEEYIQSVDAWRTLHKYIKSQDFIFDVVKLLTQHFIDLGLPTAAPSLEERLRCIVSGLRRGRVGLRYSPYLSSRFDFSMLPAAGGCIKPHTDAPQKLITLVLSMVEQGKWNPSFGGGTDILRPLDTTKTYNFLNNYLEFEEVETVTTFDFVPNQCAIFVKTFNSIHCVRPMTGMDSDQMRKTVTINIERLD